MTIVVVVVVVVVCGTHRQLRLGPPLAQLQWNHGHSSDTTTKMMVGVGGFVPIMILLDRIQVVLQHWATTYLPPVYLF
jgi:hypothetical protein